MRCVFALAALLCACGHVPDRSNDGGPPDAGVAGDEGPVGDDAARDAGARDAGSIAPVVVDVLLRDNDAGVEHLNLEVSPDMRWATLNERDQRTLRVRPASSPSTTRASSSSGALTRSSTFAPTAASSSAKRAGCPSRWRSTGARRRSSCCARPWGTTATTT